MRGTEGEEKVEKEEEEEEEATHARKKGWYRHPSVCTIAIKCATISSEHVTKLSMPFQSLTLA